MNTIDNFKLRIGIVTNKEDKDKKGKVQIRVMPDLQGVKEANLPWARPFFTSGMNKNNYSMELPEVGADVFCLVKDDFKTFYYMQGIFIDGFFDYEGVVKSQLDNIEELSDSAYPNINFKLVNDGTILFHNSKNGDFGYIHNTGTYHIVNSDGEVVFYTKDKKVKIYNDNLEFSLNDDGSFLIEGEGRIEGKTSGQIDINNGNLTVDA